MSKAIVFCVLVLFFLLSVTSSPAQAHVDVLQDSTAIFQILTGINTARIANGLTPYVLNPLLTQAAQMHSEYQRDTGQVTHNGPGGTRALDRVLAVGYPAARANENIYGGMVGPQDAVNWWLGSTAGHVQNILHPVMREIGVGVAPSSDGMVYYTVVFSAQPNVLPIFINNDAYSTNNPSVTLALTNEEIFGSLSAGIGRAAQIMISNTPDLANSASQPWSQFVNWTLDTSSGDGLKTVYVRFIDGAGHTADSQDIIVLDTSDGGVVVAPTSMSTYPPLPTAAPLQPVTSMPWPTNTSTLVPTVTPGNTSASEPIQTTVTPTARVDSMRATQTTITPMAPGQQLILGLPTDSIRMVLWGTLGLGLVCLVAGSLNLMRTQRTTPEQREEENDAAED